MTSVEALLRASGAVKEGHFALASGKHSDRYVEKFDLLRRPALTSSLLSRLVPRVSHLAIDVVAGPTTGGILLAFELARQMDLPAAYAERADDGSSRREFRRGTTFSAGTRVLVIDDILTTGGSIRATLAALEPFAVEVVGVAVLVDRRGTLADFDGLPLFALASMEIAAWEPDACPLCQRGEPLIKPGTTGRSAAA